MTEFTITSTKWESEIRLVFYDNGFLASAELPEVIDRKAMEFFATHFPTHVSVLDFIRENIMITLDKYVRRYSGTKKEFQPLASTFLNQRMWEAELESGRKDEFSLLHLFNAR